MGTFAAGQVVVLPFPFSDLSRSKYRPALLIAHAGRGDWIACQITSNPYSDPHAVEIKDTDFASGGLQRISYARPGKLFTANWASRITVRRHSNPTGRSIVSWATGSLVT